MEDKSKKGKTIKLKSATAQRLDKLRHQGQTYDGIVSELIDHYEKKEEERVPF